MVAPAGKPQLQCRHGVLLFFWGFSGFSVIATIFIVSFRILSFLQFILERDRGVNHHSVALCDRILDSAFELGKRWQLEAFGTRCNYVFAVHGLQIARGAQPQIAVEQFAEAIQREKDQ